MAHNCDVCLGRYGDIINALPLALDDYLHGHKVTFMCCAEWSDILDGVSYCEKLIYPGKYWEPLQARVMADQMGCFDNIYVAQCYGTNVTRETDSFAKEAWRVVGKLDKWGKLPLVFDRRAPDREAISLEFGNDVVLVCMTGKSSPFPHRAMWESFMQQHREIQFIDIGHLKFQHIYDMLGIYERYKCLIAIDSGPLHLSYATPQLPVIALVTDSPDLWHGCPERPNHRLRIRYREFPARMGEIIPLIKSL